MSRPARVHLVRHAPTVATRRHTFPTDEPLDERGAAQAARLTGVLFVDRVVTSPSARCRQTATWLAPDDVAPEVDDRWTELDFGTWAGRTIKQVWTDDTARLQRWLDDPTFAPPDGEPLASLAVRVDAALAELHGRGTTTAVVTSGGPIKVAVLAALDARWSSIWNLDVIPCSATTLHARAGGGWTVRAVNVPADVRVPA